MTVSVERALATRLQGRREHLLVAFRVALWTDTRRDEILPLKKEELNFTDMPVIRELDGDKYEAPPLSLFIEKSESGGASYRSDVQAVACPAPSRLRRRDD
jgi:hypothetical protein